MSRLRGPGVVTREMDGTWFAFFAGAEHEAEDEVGWGDSPEEAIGNLLGQRRPNYRPKEQPSR